MKTQQIFFQPFMIVRIGYHWDIKKKRRKEKRRKKKNKAEEKDENIRHLFQCATLNVLYTKSIFNMYISRVSECMYVFFLLLMLSFFFFI